MTGKEIDPLSIMSFSNNGVPPERWKDLLAIWKEPAPPGNKVEVFVEPLQDAVLLRDFDQAVREVQDLRKGKPKEIRQWMPYACNLFNGLTQDRAYDSRPSTHYKRETRDIMGNTGIAQLDRALKGGLWSASTNLFIGISNHGKSTMAYTIAAQLVQKGIRTAFISTEMPPTEVAIGVLRPMGNWSDREVRLQKVDASVELQKLDRYLAIYDYKHSTAEALDRIVYWEKPSVVIWDYLKAPDDSSGRKREDQELSSLVEGIRNVGIDHGVCTFVFAQFSDTKANEFRNTHNVSNPSPFGSARVYHAADQVVIMMRHWLEPDTEFFKVKKDKLPPTYIDDNLLDWEFTLQHDRKTRSFWSRV